MMLLTAVAALLLLAGTGDGVSTPATVAVLQGAPAGAERPAGADGLAGVVDQAAADGIPVMLQGDTLFLMQRPLGPFSARYRASALTARLEELVRVPLTDSIYVLEYGGRSEIMIGDAILTTVSDADAEAAALPREMLAAARAEILDGAVRRGAIAANFRALLSGGLFALLATVGLVLLYSLLRLLTARARHRLEVWRRARIGAVRLQNVEIISGTAVTRAVATAITILRVVLTALLGYAYLLLVFSLFPATRGTAAKLVEYVADPIAAATQAIAAYIPHLFYIAVILLVAWYTLKLIALVFNGIGSGAITLAGFYPDWADTTYKLVRMLVIALTLILIWPHLPSSDRPEFKGVAAFLGLLLSLGAASAVANVIGGVLMVYMRPFQIGDRVKIADAVGDVVEKTLLVTRMRTTKNVDITIPNSMVLGSHIINYSSTARNGGLVLHTTVTLGYDVPWRKVHEVLIEAALRSEFILQEPRPFVLQTALNDFHVSYELNAYTEAPNRMTRTYSELHQHIQDACAAADIEILSPTYQAERDGTAITIPR